jgi:arylsulfatase A-like enzyme
MRTGQKPMGPIQYPSIGASLANQLAPAGLALPGYVSIGPYRAFNQDAFGPGFLGPRFGPLIVGATDVPGGATNGGQGFPELKVQSLERSAGITADRMDKRLELWRQLQSDFLATRGGAAKTHHTVYQSAVQLMSSEDAKAFDLSAEPEKLREEYGRTVFGQGCLLARRLVEHGVAFVEVSLGTSSGGVGWDTHSDNFNAVRQLSSELDAGWATLMRDLDDRGLLESTTILWMGEFGRTPVINPTAGRDHFPNAWSTVLAGGGVAGGQAFGKTSEDGMRVVEGQVGVADLLATLCQALGVSPSVTQLSNTGRPIAIADGTPIKEVLA